MKLTHGCRRILSDPSFQLFVAFFVIYAVTSPGGYEVSDGEARYYTAKSWVEGNGGALPPGQEFRGVPGRNGHYYSWYGPFQSVLMAPFVALIGLVSRGNPDHLFKLTFNVLIVPAISALGLAVLFRALRSLHFGSRHSFFTVAVIGLATPMWHYGRSGQEENIIGLAFAFYLWGMGHLLIERYDGLKLIGLAASVIFATRMSYVAALVILSIPVAVVLWQRRAQWRRWRNDLAIALLPAGAVVGAVLWYNTYRYGTPLETGYGTWFRLHPPFFTFGDAPNHFLALAISPYRGLLWFCPTLLLLIGLRRVRKGWIDRRLWLAILGACAFTYLFISSFFFWNAGPAWGPRYFVALLVLIAPAFASVFASGQRWWAVLAVSVVVQFCSTVLPSSSEDFAADNMNAARPGTCTPWVCRCSALCMRGPWAAQAIGNTLSSRALPTVELTDTERTPGGISALETSDFNSVYWWPVRAAYRAHRLDPALAFVLCMLALSGSCATLWLCYRRLPEGSPGAPSAG